MVQRVAEGVGGGQGVGAHPEQVGRVEVGANHRADGVAQLEQRAHVVHALVAVQFEGNALHAMGLGQACDLAPERQQAFFPLVAQHGLRLWRPRGDDPVGHAVAGLAFGQAGHGAHGLDPQFTGEADRVLEALRLFRLGRVQRVAVGVEGDDFQVVLFETAGEIAASGVAVEHLLQVEVRRGGPAPGVHFQARQAHAFSVLEHIAQRQVAEGIGDKSQFHSEAPSRGR